MYLLRTPLQISFQRYIKIFITERKLSIFRALQNEGLSKIQFKGKVLDLGGGNNVQYLEVIRKSPGHEIYESVNISAEYHPTFIVKPGDLLPIRSNEYDMVISINTLEHIYDVKSSLRELFRGLKPGGK